MLFAPATCHAGRLPSGWIGSIVHDVCTPCLRRSCVGSTPWVRSELDDEVAGQVVADRADRDDCRAEASEVDGGTAGGAGRGRSDLVEEQARLALGQLDDRAAEDVHDVGTGGHDRRVGGAERGEVRLVDHAGGPPLP